MSQAGWWQKAVERQPEDSWVGALEALWMQEVAAVDGSHPAASGYLALADLVTEWAAWQHWFEEDDNA